MNKDWLGRPTDAAAQYFLGQGRKVETVLYTGRRVEPMAQDLRVVRCREVDGGVQLVVCKFQTELSCEEES